MVGERFITILYFLFLFDRKNSQLFLPMCFGTISLDDELHRLYRQFRKCKSTFLVPSERPMFGGSFMIKLIVKENKTKNGFSPKRGLGQ